jgi:hypothetical protein
MGSALYSSLCFRILHRHFHLGSFWTPSMERNEIEAKLKGEKQ